MTWVSVPLDSRLRGNDGGIDRNDGGIYAHIPKGLIGNGVVEGGVGEVGMNIHSDPTRCTSIDSKGSPLMISVPWVPSP